MIDPETNLILVLENINTKNCRKVLTAKSDFDNFTLNSKMTELNNPTKMTKSINQEITISN